MRITCLVDNTAARGSAFYGEHGLSMLIETADGTLLWDTGQTATVLLHNLDALNRPPKRLDVIALSHAHIDHTGGLMAALQRFPGTPVHAHASLFTERLSVREGETRSIGIEHLDALHQLTHFVLAAEPDPLLPGVTTTGTIAPRPYPQGSAPSLKMRREGQILPDAFEDDMSLLLDTPRGVVLVCGCCHAGLRNTLLTMRRLTARPLLAILGGTHLTSVSAAEIGALIDELGREGSPQIYLNHCTGETALFRLQQTFGDRVHPCPAGTVLDLDKVGS